MFSCGDQVMYGIHGVCRIVALEERKVDRKKIEYYVLEPLERPDAKYYVPTQNEAAVAKLRRIMTASELDALLHSDEVEKESWIPDENQRKQYYRELISGGDRGALISMVRTLHRHREAQAAMGRKFHLCDENFLKDAEKLLSSELSLVLNIQQSQVGEYVQSVIAAK